MGLGRIFLVLLIISIPLSSQSGIGSSDESTEDCSDIPVSIPHSVTKINDALEYESCFDNKEISYVIYTDREPTPEENLTLLKGDLNICNCLREKALTNSILRDRLDKGSKSDTTKKHLNGNIRDAIQENGKLLFDASMICHGKDVNNCIGLWAAGRNDSHYIADKPKIMTSTSDSSDYMKRAGVDLVRKKNRDTVRAESLKFSESLLSESSLSENQCVFGREYIAFKQKESFEAVSETLKKLDSSNFNPDEWDYRKLKSRYDVYMTKPGFRSNPDNKETLENLKNKLIFLNYHPMIKTFLTIEPIDESTLSNKKEYEAISSRRRVDAKFYQKEKLNKMKTDALNILKKYASPHETVCTLENSQSCMDNVLDEKKYKEFHEKLGDFFIRPDIGPATKAQSYKLTTDLLEQDSPQKSSTLPLTQKALMSAHLADFPGMNPDECLKGNVESQCPEIYGGYCKKIDSIKSKISADAIDIVPDDLEFKLSNSFNTDLKTNADFATFNKKMCETKYRFKNKGDFTFNDYRKNNCKKRDMRDCREQFFKKTSNAPQEIMHFNQHNSIFNKNGTGKVDTKRVFNESGYNDWEKARQEQSYGDIPENESYSFKESFDGISEEFSSENIKDITKIDPSTKDTADAKAPFSFNPDYSASSLAGSALDDKKSDKQKIENMPDEKKKNLLSDWESEYENWKKNKNATDSNQLSPADSAKDSLYKKEIETLRALLDEQKKLTETQSKLLNDAISRRNSEVSSGGNQKTGSVKEKNSQNSSVFGNNPTLNNNSSRDEDSFSRSPASLSEAGKLGNLSNGGNAFKNSSNSGSSSRRTSAENSDSLAREQAKLVNVKSFSDGSILVEPNSSSAPNAITLSVSDEQYKALLVNPTGLSLNQIEKSIPVDQIGKLEKSGEIILLLKNGSNPPFEVKVERKQNKLVYSLKDKNGNDQKPVRRVFTRKALENELKVQR